jgi:hypothetical protein
MANGILRLANAGCQVIVDDINYPREEVFQEGIIEQVGISCLGDDTGNSPDCALTQWTRHLWLCRRSRRS